MYEYVALSTHVTWADGRTISRILVVSYGAGIYGFTARGLPAGEELDWYMCGWEGLVSLKEGEKRGKVEKRGISGRDVLDSALRHSGLHNFG